LHGDGIKVCPIGHGAWLSKERLAAIDMSPGQEGIKEFFHWIACLMEPPAKEDVHP
jgi:hypothetical protein